MRRAELDVLDSSLSGTAGAADTNACDGEFLVDAVARVGADDVQHARPQGWETVERRNRRGAVEGRHVDSRERFGVRVDELMASVAVAVAVVVVVVVVVVRQIRPEEREDFLVARGGEGDALSRRVQTRGKVAQAVGHVAIEHARVPAAVERVLEEHLASEGAGRPRVAPLRRHQRRQPVPADAEDGRDGRLEEDERGEQPRVHQSKVYQVAGAHAVRDADDRSLDLRPEVVHHLEQVAGVVLPRRWERKQHKKGRISLRRRYIFLELTARKEVRNCKKQTYARCPVSPRSRRSSHHGSLRLRTKCLGRRRRRRGASPPGPPKAVHNTPVDSLSKTLFSFKENHSLIAKAMPHLAKSNCMRADDSDIAVFRISVRQGNILLHREEEFGLFIAIDRMRILPDVLTRDVVLNHAKRVVSHGLNFPSESPTYAGQMSSASMRWSM